MRYVVVGYGNVGHKRRRVLGARCAATVDPYRDDADYPRLEDVPADAYDAAVLAVPNSAKLALLEALLGRGKHVLVEKPLLFPDEALAARLRETAEARGAVWYTSYNLRFEPHVQTLRRLIADGSIGTFYRAKLFYGYGTAADIAGSWRDDRLGVIQDLATHLIDLVGYVFGRFGAEFVVWAREAHEVSGVDHCILATADRRIVLECSYLSWKNRWTIDVVGSKGSLLVEGLTKWGPATLTVRRRRLPSGVPDEERDVVTVADSTWAADIAHFEEMAAAGRTSCENDLWVSRTVLRAAASALA
ncbi:MAG: Gfo/Idh/MocA family protein [bacterium]